jgi:tRNA dimethylallyltransferase
MTMSDRSAARAVLSLMGPTATGKTDLALALAERLPVALISVDSAMVYRGLDIGTAKPAAETLARHPHALIDVRDPVERFSAGDFVAAAESAVKAAHAADRLPLLVGGTMLYFRSFKTGMARLPPIASDVRDALAERLKQDGLVALYDELARVDPAAAAGIHPHNPQRILRALEVYWQTGRPLSAFWRQDADAGPVRRNGWRLIEFALDMRDRDELHARIDVRFRQMLERGFVEEVAQLRTRGDLSADMPSMRAVGYRQVWNYLDGRGSYEDMCLRGTAATRQLARRQLTWLRRWKGAQRLSAAGPDACGAILNYLEAVAILPHAQNKGAARRLS